jgi:hypothetical protein
MSLDITRCLEEEYKSLRERCGELGSCSAAKDQRAAAEALLPALNAHTLAEEDVVISRAAEIEELRPMALKALEEHEVVEHELVRLWQSVDEEQFSARASVVCDLLSQQWKESEEKLLPKLRLLVPEEEREDMAIRYREIKERHRITSELRMPDRGSSAMQNQAGRLGYIIAWLLGVPAWLLLIVFLIKG